MFFQRSREGYLLIDNRCSGGTLQEYNTVTCSHCQTQVVLNTQRTRARGFCRQCNHYVCDSPSCNTGCNSFARLADKYLEQAFRKNNG